MFRLSAHCIFRSRFSLHVTLSEVSWSSTPLAFEYTYCTHTTRKPVSFKLPHTSGVCEYVSWFASRGSSPAHLHASRRPCPWDWVAAWQGGACVFKMIVYTVPKPRCCSAARCAQQQDSENERDVGCFQYCICNCKSVRAYDVHLKLNCVCDVRSPRPTRRDERYTHYTGLPNGASAVGCPCAMLSANSFLISQRRRRRRRRRRHRRRRRRRPEKAAPSYRSALAGHSHSMLRRLTRSRVACPTVRCHPPHPTAALTSPRQPPESQPIKVWLRGATMRANPAHPPPPAQPTHLRHCTPASVALVVEAFHRRRLILLVVALGHRRPLPAWDHAALLHDDLAHGLVLGIDRDVGQSLRARGVRSLRSTPASNLVS